MVDSSVKAGGNIKIGGKVPVGEGAFYPATVIEVNIDNIKVCFNEFSHIVTIYDATNFNVNEIIKIKL